MSEGEEDDTSKTEDPTQKKLDDAKKKGQVPMSREINNWVMIMAGTIVVIGFGPDAMKDLTMLMKTFLAQTAMLPEVPGGFQFLVMQALLETLKILGLPLLLLMVAAFTGPFIQVGPMFAPEVIKMDISKISPMKGFARIFSMKSIMEFVKGILKIAVVSIVGLIIIKPYFGQIEHLVGLEIPYAMAEIKELVFQLLIGILFVLFIIAGLDLMYQRYEHMKKMRMTKQELKDEYKQSEGDPHVKARLKQLRQEKARARMMQAVPQSDVVITNPTHYSIALKYDPDKNDAPVVVAKGVDELALRIREIARENDVAIMANPPLARALYRSVDVDEAVPAEHYKAVAEVISYVFRLKGKLK